MTATKDARTADTKDRETEQDPLDVTLEESQDDAAVPEMSHDGSVDEDALDTALERVVGDESVGHVADQAMFDDATGNSSKNEASRSVPWPPSEDVDDDPEIAIPFMGGSDESVSSGVMEISNSELERFGVGEVFGTPDLENQTWEDGTHHSWDLSTSSIGKEGERLAAAYLSQQGYEVVKTNEWFANNEVDIVAYDPNEHEYVLVEVKTRVDLGADEVIPEIAVTREKQRRYRNAALLYLATRDLSHVRFDVIAINIVAERHARLRHLIGAYNFDY